MDQVPEIGFSGNWIQTKKWAYGKLNKDFLHFLSHIF